MTQADVSRCRTAVTYTIRLTGSQNIREHHFARSKRVKAERSTAERVCRASLERPTCWPVVVRLTRIGPRKLDSLNAFASLKGTQDGVADWLGVDDGDESKVRWQYAKEKGPFGVRIEVLTVAESLRDIRARLVAGIARAPVVAAELDGADPGDIATWDEVLP